MKKYLQRIKDNINSNIARRMHAFIICFVVIPITIVIIFSMFLLLDLVKHTMFLKEQRELAVVENNFMILREICKNEVLKLSSYSQIKSMKTKEIRSILTETADSRNKFNALMIVDTSGKIIYDTDNTKGTVSEEEYFKRIRFYQDVGFEYVYSEVNYKPIDMVVSKKIFSDSEHIGYVLLFLPIEEMKSFLWEKLDRDAHFIIVQDDGNILLDSDAENERLIDTYIDFEPVLKALSGENGSGKYFIDKKIQYVGYRNIQNLGYGIVSMVPVNVIFQQFIYIQMFFYVIIIFIMFILIYLITKLGLGIGKPLLALSKTMDEVSEGKEIFEIDSEILDRKDQIGILANASNRMYNTIINLTDYDSLTKLLNINAFNRYVTETISRAKQNSIDALIFLDIDNFKYINSTYTYEIGDEILMKIAEILSDFFESKAIIARDSADQFAIYVMNIDNREGLIVKLQELKTFITTYFAAKSKDWYITVSFGVCFRPYDGNNMITLSKNASIALEESRRSGNEIKIYNFEYSENIYEKIKIKNDMVHALKNEEFIIYYQPQIYSKNKKIKGFEALIRWNHDELGILQPNKFISIAEETRLIIPLTEWILRETCRKIKRFIKFGLENFTVSVNISPVHFMKKGFLGFIKQLIVEENINPKYLCLEITENSTLDDTEMATYIMKQLNQAGIKISLDDFGTGYSTLKCVFDFPFSCVKFDKSLIDNIAADEAVLTVISAIADIGHKLGFDIIAEGVESEKQIQILKNIGCFNIQGYYYSKPLCYEELIKNVDRFGFLKD